jgi:hypothetical protein
MLKRTKIIITLLLMSITSSLLYGQKLNDEERKLYNIIMSHRKARGLPQIPLSKSLTYVAQTHARDVSMNRPVHGECNGHSWSDKGKWTPCCYTADHAQANCMWLKPSELTGYTGYGFEIGIITVPGYTLGAEMMFAGWQTSPQHYALIVNNAPWENSHWKAIGIGIYKEFGCVWFGIAEDK